MTTEAQVRANRSNAEKSTGPRTAEGKEKASRNSLKHGLLAREGVIRGEDPEEYEMHREMLLEQLDPVGPLEAMLAGRIVDLFWRLQRAGQNQNEVFEALYDRHIARQVTGPEALTARGQDARGTKPTRGQDVRDTTGTRGQDARGTDEARGRSAAPTRSGDAWDTEAAEQRGTLLGRMILEDFEHEAVLERLLRYERRIESSLYRTLKELRHVHDQGRKADQEVAGTLQRWRQEDGEARKARAFACEPPPEGWPAPGDATTNTPEAGDDCGLGSVDCGVKDAGQGQRALAEVAHPSEIPSLPFTHPMPDSLPEDETCETNPISEGVSRWKCEGSGELCKTNPISPGAEEGPAARGEEVRSDADSYDTT